ncbi:4Fe-4S dicluster domain-containing protein, partial [Chlamydiales bacterium]|nr:4Fe-4S dicluster domain-containing protein [Chlamydiales bacterium]
LQDHPLTSLELIDQPIIESAKSSPIAKHHLSWVKGNPKAILIAETEGKPIHPTSFIQDPQEMASVWEVRKRGLELLLSKRSYKRALGFLEDMTIPPESLAPFIKRFVKILGPFADEMSIYGHAGSGCLHIRPFVDMRSPKTLSTIKKIMEETTDLVLEYGGTLSGEHGDGMIRSWLNKKLFGEEIYKQFLEVKNAFDPHHILNPNKIVNAPFPTETHSFPKEERNTFLDFSKEGGFDLSLDLCNGNGQCRKSIGLMCPSYQVTRDEYDVTRGRAQALRQTPGLHEPSLKEILSLCLQCRGCKTECPSSVDMAKMKSEVLFHQSKGFKDYLFASFPKIIPYISWRKRFSSQISPFEGKKEVVLFNDTYTEFIRPNIGLSAVKILKSLGYKVYVPPWHCCQRPLFSKGFLKEATVGVQKVIDLLTPYALKGLPILTLEPSCTSMLQEDILSLPLKRANLISDHITPLDHFLLEVMDQIQTPTAHLLVHTHCHQKSSSYKDATKELLQKVTSYQVEEIASGCCGMAGSFGYEHPKISKAIYNQVLHPTLIENPNSLVVANGFSCRTQTKKFKPLHFTELLCLNG